MSELGDAQKFLTIEQAADRIREMGPAYEMGTDRQVKRWADEGKLPFFIGFNRKRAISEQELVTALVKLQLEAVKAWRKEARSS